MNFWLSLAFVPTEELVPLSLTAEECNLDGLAISDHIFFPKNLKSRYPYSAGDGRPVWEPEAPWPDVWVTIGALASITERLAFLTSAYVAPARDLFTVAKAVSTASVLSRGRLKLGLAAGWMREEFDALGQSFDGRGQRLDEMIVALRTMLTTGWSEFHGRYYDFDAIQMSPMPERIPAFICGGHSDNALRRAAALGDGWLGNAYTEEEADYYINRLNHFREAEIKRADVEEYEIVIALMSSPSRDLHRRWEEKGVTGLLCVPWAGLGPNVSLAEKQGAIRKFADQFVG